MPPEALDSLDKDSLKLLLVELLAQNKALTEQIGVLLVRIAELEARNGQPPKTPTNHSPLTHSHVPPGARPAGTSNRAAKVRSARRAASRPTATPDLAANGWAP